MAFEVEIPTLLKDTEASALDSPCETTCLISGERPRIRAAFPWGGAGSQPAYLCPCTHLYRYGHEALGMGPFSSQTRSGFIYLNSLPWQCAHLDVFFPIFSFYPFSCRLMWIKIDLFFWTGTECECSIGRSHRCF